MLCGAQGKSLIAAEEEKVAQEDLSSAVSVAAGFPAEIVLEEKSLRAAVGNIVKMYGLCVVVVSDFAAE